MNKMFDYLVMGRPIIFAGNIPDCPIELAHAGPTCEPTGESIAAAIEGLANLNHDERQTLATNGRAYVEAHHTMAKLARDFEGVLKEAIRSPR
jgi:glycosyltransferase involved in cell wall biosynthesis